MWRAIFGFELRYQLSQPLFYISAAVLFLLALGLASTGASDTFSGLPNNVFRNAPLNILRQLTVFSILGLFVVTAFVTSSVLRDFEHGTYALFFTKPIRRFDYLAGRFAGSMAVSSALFVVACAGLAAANFVPWQDAARVGPFRIEPYLYGLAVMVLPNVLVIGACLFSLAIWSRRALWPYLFVVFYMVVQDVIEEIATNVDRAFLGSLIEPSGLVALRNVSRYWTSPELNHALPDLALGLISNRLLWLALAAIVLAVGFARFRQAESAATRSATAPSKRERKRAARQGGVASATVDPAAGIAEDDVAAPALAAPASAERAAALLECVRGAQGPVAPALTRWRQWWQHTRLETAQVFAGIPFIVLLALGIVFAITMAMFIGQNRGIPVHPVTHLMLQSIRTGMGTFLVVTLIFYAGELVWRERALSVSGVLDAMPAPTWVFLTAKLAALLLVAAAFVGTGILATAAVQVAQGFTDIQPGLYAKGFVIIMSSYVPLAALLLFLQTVSINKSVGFLLAIIVLVVRNAGPAIGLEHHLLLYGSFPALPYSDLNGYGHFADAFVGFDVYWNFAAALVLVATTLLWKRGTDRSLRGWLGQARRRWRGGTRVAAAVAAVGLIASGAFIVYNTMVLNEFLPRSARLDRRAQYEREYAEYKDAALPRIMAVRTEMDLDPARRRISIRGEYELENTSVQSIVQLNVSTRTRTGPIDYLPFSGRLTLRGVTLPAHQVSVADDRVGFYVYDLAEPLAPGQRMAFGFDIEVAPRGFKNGQEDQRILGNGTFFANKNLLPSLGYVAANEIQSPGERRKRGLPELTRTAAIDDLAAHERNYLQADWTHYETTISTSADQIAIAPGQLEREWSENGRRYFHYVTEQPVINLATFMSGDYEVTRDRWNDVAIEVYFHAGHPYNVQRMIDATKATLDYCTEHFGPYPRRVLRIVEVPNYVGLTAFSLAGVIAFSESWGFISKVSEDDFDSVSEVMAHEVAHQWWNHQVVPADVQGATMVSETLSQYTALMVIEAQIGARPMQRHLRFELDRYLTGRGREPIAELPLARVENQPYIHYNKGSLVMYALQARVGEDVVNAALRRFLESQAFQGPPYTDAAALLGHLRESLPDDAGELVDDMFESIILFDNRIAAARCRENGGGGFELELHATMNKRRDDGRGAETDVLLDDWLDVAVYGEQEVDGQRVEKLLYFEPHPVARPDVRIRVVLDARPTRVEIDPYQKLIDRMPDDNVRRVTMTTESS